MTLHIPNGLKITGALASPFALSAAIRPLTRGVAADLWYSLLAGEVAERIDATRAGRGDDLDQFDERALRSHDLACAIARDLREHVDTATLDQVRRSPMHDLGFTIKVLAHPDDPAALLAIVHAERSAYRDALLNLDGVSEYGWWSTERPQSDDWATRREVWSRALRAGIFSDEGWTWSLFGTILAQAVPELDERTDLERVVAALPDDEARAHALARRLTTLPEDLLRSRDTSRIVRALTEQHQKNYEPALAMLAPITVDDLAW